jgi:hypothetical protein
LAFAATYGMKLAPERLTMEGGNLLSNGRGLCVSSTTLIEQNKMRGYDLQVVGSILQSDFRFKQWTYLPPLAGEPTGHVDMFVTLTSPTTAIVGQYDPRDDAVNARQLYDVDAAAPRRQMANVHECDLRQRRRAGPPIPRYLPGTR